MPLSNKKKGFYLKEKFLDANESLKSLTITPQKHNKDNYTSKRINTDTIVNFINSDKIKRSDFVMQNHSKDEYSIKNNIKRTDLAIQNAPVEEVDSNGLPIISGIPANTT
ncbi:4191_t:CDS:2, partial [Racocetra fulgida]